MLICPLRLVIIIRTPQADLRRLESNFAGRQADILPPESREPGQWVNRQ
jgi:hypothetical protein